MVLGIYQYTNRQSSIANSFALLKTKKEYSLVFRYRKTNYGIIEEDDFDSLKYFKKDSLKYRTSLTLEFIYE